MITIINGSFTDFKFPCGEQHVKVDHCDDDFPNLVDIDFEFENMEEIFKLLLICNALKHMGRTLHTLTMYYVPFSRQDRVTSKGEPFSLEVFCQLINSLNFVEVVISDPHSQATTLLLNNCIVISQEAIFEPMLNELKEKYCLVSPDGGSLKKIYQVAKCCKPTSIVLCSKNRDVHTGDILETVVYNDNFHKETCVIVDDICDGGRTFIEIAKVLKKKNAGKIILCVTHGFFTKGLEVFDGLIDEIYTRGGKVK